MSIQAQLAAIERANNRLRVEVQHVSREDVQWLIDTLRAEARRIDAIESRLIELECMGTTGPYVNVWGPDTDIYSTGGKVTLRQAMDKAIDAQVFRHR